MQRRWMMRVGLCAGMLMAVGLLAGESRAAEVWGHEHEVRQCAGVRSGHA
jgi:hypothetical protein